MFGVSGLTAWVIMGVAWTICSAVVVIIYPFYESRDALEQICRGIFRVCGHLYVLFRTNTKHATQDLTGKSSRHLSRVADDRVGVP